MKKTIQQSLCLYSYIHWNIRTIYGEIETELEGIGLSYWPTRARICKLLRSPGIDSKESIPGLLKILKIPSLLTDSAAPLSFPKIYVYNKIGTGPQTNTVQYSTVAVEFF
jgi:hypothetical protein